MMRKLFSFPNPVNEKAARVVAGAVLVVAVVILATGFYWLLIPLAGDRAVADGLLILLSVAAGLESIFAVCLGCEVFGLLMRLGVIPEEVCAECADIRLRLGSPRQAQT